MIGAALGGGAAGLFSETRNPEIARAAKLQSLQSQWGPAMKNIDMTDPAQIQTFGNRMIKDLAGIGETELAFQMMGEMQAFQPEGVGISGKDDQGKVDKLRGSINKFTGDMRTIQSAYNKIQRVAKERTATGDMSMVFSIMKLNDPGSTVREGEYATAKNAGGVPDRLRNLYNNAIDGRLLQESQRQQFLATAENLYQGERESADTAIGHILQQADADQISRERVFGKSRLEAYQKRQSKKPTPQGNGLAPAEQRELEALEKEFGGS